jgi:ArsR family transcriptional regulator
MPPTAERQTRLTARAEIIKALAHPSRLLIVEELGAGERCVRDLTDLVGADISTVSRHLSVLRHAGLVATEKRGTQVFYRLRTRCVLSFFECVEAVLRGEETAACACR